MSEIQEYVRREISSPVTGIVLYGSQARQDATPTSDTDVLIVTPAEAGKHYSRQYSIVSYTENELSDVFGRGTLMGDHLKQDSRIIYDPEQRMQDIYETYVEPDPDKIENEITQSRMLLGVSRDKFEQNPYNFVYLVRYLCRTSAILLHHKTYGTYSYSNRAVAAALEIPELEELGFHHSPTKEDWPRFLRLSTLSGKILLGNMSDVEPVDLQEVVEENKVTNPRLANLAYGLPRAEKLSPIRLFSTSAYDHFPYVHPDSV